jgi:hypothetical protein
MSKLFKYGKFTTVSIIPKNNGLKNYGDYKKKIIKDLKRHIEIIEDPSKLKLDGESRDPPYISELSTVADDLSVIELTLRCKRKMFDFGAKGEKYFKFVVPIENRDVNTVQAIRLKLIYELIENVEDDEYKTLIKTFIRKL